MREQLEEAMKDPKVQAQTQELSQMMQSPEMLQKLAQLREDPELKPMFEEMQKGGMGAMMKFMNDPVWLAKVSEKLGDPRAVAAGAAAPTAGSEAPTPAAVSKPPPPPHEITNIIEAARFGDLEAVEDFIAVGKDVNQTDPEKRTALHYAVAYKHRKIFDELLASGAELTAEDKEGNTPLHYAAGYGRGEFVKDLIDAGAKGFSKNQHSHTPYDLVKMEKKNPINGDHELMKLLEVASST